MPIACNARQAFSTQTPTDPASFKQGITTETSICSGTSLGGGAASGFTGISRRLEDRAYFTTACYPLPP